MSFGILDNYQKNKYESQYTGLKVVSSNYRPKVDMLDLRLFQSLANQPVWTENELNSGSGIQFFGNNGWHKIFARAATEYAKKDFLNYFQPSSKFSEDDGFDYKGLKDNYDLYFTLNTFNKQSGTVKDLDKLNGLYVDIDFKNKGLHWNEAYLRVVDILEESMIYKPNFIIDSGHGMWLIWVFEESVGAGTKKIVSLYKTMLRKLASIFSSIGGDFAAATPERLIRYPNTFNFKDSLKKKTKLIGSGDKEDYFSIISDEKWDFDEFKENILDYSEYIAKKEKFKKKKKKNNNNKHWRGNEKTLGINRAEDLEDLVFLRGGDMIGCRSLFLFYYRNSLTHSGCGESEIEEKVYQINSQFSISLLVKEVKDALKTPINHIPRNETIIQALFIGEEEMEGFRTLISPKIKKDRKLKAQIKMYSKTKEYNQKVKLIKKYKSWNMFSEGKSLINIADFFSVSTRSIRRWIDEFNEILNLIKNNSSNKFNEMVFLEQFKMVVDNDQSKENDFLKTLTSKENKDIFSLILSYTKNKKELENKLIDLKKQELANTPILLQNKTILVKESVVSNNKIITFNPKIKSINNYADISDG